MRRRLVICLGILCGLCFIAPAIAILCLNNSVERLTSLAESHRMQWLRAELVGAGIRIERDLLQSANRRPLDRDVQVATLRRFDETLVSCGDCHHEPVVEGRMDQLRAAFDRYRAKADLSIVVGDGADFARDPEVQELAAGVVNRATELADGASKHLVVKTSDAATSVRRSWIVLVATLLGSITGAGLVAVHLKRRLTTPLRRLLDGVERVRQGDVEHRFQIDGDDEHRALGDALNRAYEEVRTAENGMLQAEKMAFVGKLAAGVAHEVGNPLASISSVAQMMRRECHNDKEAERIDLITQHIDRISRVVQELLTFSRPVRCQGHARVRISGLLDRTISLLRYDKRADRVRIIRQYGSDLCIAHGDGDQLLLVFTNILVNALDAVTGSSNGAASVVVAADEQDDRIIIRFEDDGPGMTQEQVNAAFEPFFTTKAPGSGTGLGLWICRQIVRRHHASIRIGSRVGEGTTVIVELPKQAPQPAEARTAS